jgi:hypothetical protein
MGFVVFVSLLRVEASARTALSVDKLEHDFGVIHPWASVSETFRLRNDGDSPVRITEIETSCGCTTTDLTESLLNPGESRSIVVTFDPEGLEGSVERTVTIHAEEQAATILRLRALIRRPFDLSQRDVHFEGAEVPGQSATVAITPAVQVRAVEVDGPLTAEVVQTPVNTSVVIRLRSGDLSSEPSGSGKVRISTDTTSAAVPIPVSWARTPVFRVNPPRVVFGGTERSASVSIVATDGAPFRITKAVSGDPRITVDRVRQGRRGGRIFLRVGPGDGIRINDVLVVTTNRAERGELRIPVLALLP